MPTAGEASEIPAEYFTSSTSPAQARSARRCADSGTAISTNDTSSRPDYDRSFAFQGTEQPCPELAGTLRGRLTWARIGHNQAPRANLTCRPGRGHFARYAVRGPRP